MQHTAVFEEQVTLTPRDMRKEIESIDSILLEKLQTKLEGKCSRHGFVLAGTVKILSRSMGVLEKGRFTGSILFQVQAEGDVLNPPDGVVLEGEVIRKNKMGMYVSYQDAVRVIVPRDLHIGDEEFENVQVKQKVRVEVKKSRFQVNDPYILSVGIFRGVAGKGQGVAVPAAEGVTEAVEAVAAPEDTLEDMLEDVEEEAEATEGAEGAEGTEAAESDAEEEASDE